MISLHIKTDQPEAELYLYDDERLISELRWQADRHLAETISSQIGLLVSKANKQLDNLNGIVVFAGPGSFTGLRIGHSVANALAYGLGVPIVSSQGKDWTMTGIAKLRQGDGLAMVLPVYGAPPRVTAPRK